MGIIKAASINCGLSSLPALYFLSWKVFTVMSLSRAVVCGPLLVCGAMLCSYCIKCGGPQIRCDLAGEQH